MDQQGHGQPLMGGAAAMGYVAAPYEGSQMMVSNSVSTGSVVTQPGTIQSSGQPTAFVTSPTQLAQQQLAYQQIQQQQQLQLFWANQYQEVEQTNDFKNHSLPLARIKKIMKADEDVRMISAEAPVVFAKACEMFILELTLRSWNHTEENKRRTLQKNDIGAAIMRTDIFDFLVDIAPREEIKDEVLGSLPRTGGSTAPVGGPSEAIPYHYMPGQQVASPGMIMGKPVMDQSLYAQLPHPYMSQQVWQQQSQSQQQQQQQQQQPTSDS
ncbi:nuclear transcription factor Y subunit C-9-like [Aristolochia californica]|uniref:nuclear transcription factor Y subunit C-9-like n=1 Tax=Aristolochia californica TaxID=171875 RepID=UPI0035E00C12